ncbi:MAG: amidohydrolase family protein [Gammaproteobacteria bacterium]|nr:amidohydrolase family protein [Gammaproteobacteria bacterium]
MSADTAGFPERRSFSRRLSLAGILLLSVCSGHLWAGETLALTGGRIIDGNGGPPLEDTAIVIRGSKITAIGPVSVVPANARVLDLAGKTLLPGLIDAHIHIGGSGGGSADRREFTPTAVENSLISYLKFGVTSVYDMAAYPGLNSMKTALDTGELVGPRLYGNGYGITAPGSHPIRLITELGLLDYLGPFYFQVDNVADAREAVRRIGAEQVDGIKLFHSRVEAGTTRFDADMDKLKPDILRSLIEEAHAHKLKVYAHTSFPSEAREIVDAGGDVIVHSIHMAETGAQDVFELMAERDLVYIPTLAVFEGDYTLKPDLFFSAQLHDKVWDVLLASITAPNSVALASRNVPGLVNDRRRSLEISMANLKRALQTGVRIAMGSDAGNAGMLHGATVLRELQLMNEAGMTPMQVIVAATRVGAEVIGQGQRLGTLEPGKLADIIIVDGDPLVDLSALGNIEMVIKNGKMIDPGKLEFKEIPLSATTE